MKTTYNLNLAINFLNDLREHNNKAWFDQNRAAYEAAKGNFEQFVDDVISKVDAFENLRGLSAKECVSRINRDIRFSKDKSPYKTNMSAMIAPGGRKSEKLGYHLSIEPHGQSIIAGGLYMPATEQLAHFRQAIDRDASEFKRITKNKTFVQYFGSIEGEKLATAPQGYSRTHPEVELLRLKQIVVVHHFADKEVLSSTFAADAAKACKAMKPFLDYLNTVAPL